MYHSNLVMTKYRAWKSKTSKKSKPKISETMVFLPLFWDFSTKDIKKLRSDVQD